MLISSEATALSSTEISKAGRVGQAFFSGESIGERQRGVDGGGLIPEVKNSMILMSSWYKGEGGVLGVEIVGEGRMHGREGRGGMEEGKSGVERNNLEAGGDL